MLLVVAEWAVAGAAVSTPTRPEDRVLPTSDRYRAAATLVSTPTRPEGRVLPDGDAERFVISKRFNPHPARRPGDTAFKTCSPRLPSRFQPPTRPEGRVIQYHLLFYNAMVMVSTPIRPSGRVLPPPDYALSDGVITFQPPPGPKAGCYLPVSQCDAVVGGGFNLHPARRPGATRLSAFNLPGSKRFQSSPGPKAGCYADYLTGIGVDVSGFNPHPAFGPGATACRQLAQGRKGRFNPHPARRPGATAIWYSNAAAQTAFQSSPGPKAGCYPRQAGPTALPAGVSILTRPEGRVLPRRLAAWDCWC